MTSSLTEVSCGEHVFYAGVVCIARPSFLYDWLRTQAHRQTSRDGVNSTRCMHKYTNKAIALYRKECPSLVLHICRIETHKSQRPFSYISLFTWVLSEHRVEMLMAITVRYAAESITITQKPVCMYVVPNQSKKTYKQHNLHDGECDDVMNVTFVCKTVWMNVLCVAGMCICEKVTGEWR